MLQTDYVIGSPLNHQDPFIQRHGSQLTANELPPFRLPFTSRRGIRLAYSFPGPARGSNIETTFTYINDLLITQLEHSNHLNRELKEFKLGIINLVEGKLSPFLIQPEHLRAAFHDIQKLLNRNYPGFGLAYQDIQNVYSSGNFLFARNNSNLYITIKLPLTYRQKALSLYKLSTIPVPINETSTHAITLLNLPPLFFITD